MTNIYRSANGKYFTAVSDERARSIDPDATRINTNSQSLDVNKVSSPEEIYARRRAAVESYQQAWGGDDGKN